jgi:hypothetical protein
MKLDQALKINIRLVCQKSDGHQPGYILQLIESHGPDAELTETLAATPCLWCKEAGGLRMAPGGT